MSEINIGTINIIFNGNMNSAQEMIPAAERCENSPAKAPVKIVTWADGTDEEIVAMVKAADEGLIDLKDYWNIGDARKVMLSETESYEWYTSHSRQEAEFVLMNAGGKDLVTATEWREDVANTYRVRQDNLQLHCRIERLPQGRGQNQ